MQTSSSTPPLATLGATPADSPARQHKSLKCPRCGDPLIRIPRQIGDRLLSLFVGVRRYQCSKHVCAWEGLRFRGRGASKNKY
jgi:hypothetical protein